MIKHLVQFFHPFTQEISSLDTKEITEKVLGKLPEVKKIDQDTFRVSLYCKI